MTATADYTVEGGARSTEATTEANVITAFPSGDTWASDHTWVSADNGWGPVERDQSNGGQGQGDGSPLTLQGQVYEKGLGAHAPSKIRYYTGGHCTTFTADVGVDDAQPSRGSVAFTVLADDQEVAASSGVLKSDSPTETITADITGAEFVDLQVSVGGDGNGNDHADWAGAKFSCG